jgi:hypothetical protein
MLTAESEEIIVAQPSEKRDADEIKTPLKKQKSILYPY